jgi:HAE1 family hydrophobic/amphiphilic exporter-1
MKLSAITLNNSVGTILIALSILVLGLLAIPNLPVSFWPEFVAPTLIVVAPYPGAGPEEIEESIAKPLEDQLSTVDGVDEVESVCYEGLARISVRFNWGVEFETAKRDVQEKTARARSRFPRQALEPTVLQVQDFIAPGIELGFSSKERGLNEIRDLIDKKIKNRILRLENVATAQISGGYTEEVLVSIDPAKLRLYGLSLTQINTALATANIDVAGGKFELAQKSYFVRAKGKYTTVQDIGSQIITELNGAPVYLTDLARVELLNKERTSISRVGGSEVVALAIREKSGGNTVAMVKEVLAEMERIRNTLPEDLVVSVISNQAQFITLAINSVVKNALLGSLLAGLIILLFLGNLRNTLIIAISIPFSVIATFLLIEAFGLSINTISLGGLALGVGMIVDASIVVLENIYRHLHMDPAADRKDTVIAAADEVGMAISASTLTSIVVFLPMAFLVGLFAVLLGELALTVIFSLGFSILVALTLVPLLSYKLMQIDRGRSFFGKISSAWQHFFDRLLEVYEPSLRRALHRPVLVLLFSVALLIASILYIAPRLDVEMLPTTNQGEFRMDLTLQEGTRLEMTDRVVREVEVWMAAQPEIAQVYAVVGRSAILGDDKANLANITIRVNKPYAKEIESLMQRVRERWQRIPGCRVVIKQLTATEGMQREPVNVRIIGDDLATLQELARQAMERIRPLPGIVNLKNTLEESLPEFGLRIDYAAATQLGIPGPAITATISQALQGIPATKLSTSGKEYDVTVRIDRGKLQNLEELLNVPLTSVRGVTYPLRAVVSASFDRSPGEIHRFDQQRVVIITADVAGVGQQKARNQVKESLGGMQLPPDYYMAFGGQSRGIADSFRSLLIALAIALFLVYVVMGAQFDSFGQPLIIALTIPLAIIGVLLGLWVFGASLSMNALLGMIMLIGIVVNNGILLIDFINQYRRRGSEKIDAVVQASVTRLRPILITSLTTIVGMLPIALGLGEGGEALQPLGAVVGGGLLTSTFLTLLVIPCTYILFTAGPKRLRE